MWSFSIQEWKEIENNLVHLFQNMKFRHVSNHFQNKLQKDLNYIEKDDHLYISADYEQLLEKSIHENYKKTDRAAINISKVDIHIAKKLDFADRINTTAEKAFICPQRP